jgi:hypothetical protein
VVPAQLDSKFLAPLVAPSFAGQREKLGAFTKAAMRKRFRCEDVPAFMHSLGTLIDKGYPRWYVESFVDRSRRTPRREA